ncbi:DinB family protein [Lentzea alba]|uniref:DinB family protein n=1 Tax=Lentzea alba TaxID=2714351 RepID=UPI0039BFEC3A
MDFNEDLRDSRFERVDLSGARFREVIMNRVVLRGAYVADVEIDGYIGKLVVNGVDVAPLVEAELNRRDPERAKMKPTDPAGYREAWEIIERLWAGTVDRARGLDPRLLHESVDGEFSFIETLRHLVFATDSWIRRAILGEPAPWHPLGLGCDGMEDIPNIPKDYAARPSLDEMLELRRDRMAGMREVLANLTEEQLASDTVAVLEPPGWPESRSYPVARCLRCILNEEWEHRRFAERDLDVLTARPT